MILRQRSRYSYLAVWGFRLAVFSAHIVVFTVLMHRYASSSTAVALNLLEIGFFAATVAFFISIIASIQIWNGILMGLGRSLAAILLSLLVLAWPLSMLPIYLMTPKLYDVSTDIKSPPKFEALERIRRFGANSTDFVEQEPFDSDIRPLRIFKSGQDSFDLVRQLVIKRKWEIISDKPSRARGGESIIEAVDRSFLLAVPDDIVIRIRSKGRQSILDIRSQTRFGSFDLGRNQQRIRSFLDDFITLNEGVQRVAEGEPLFLKTPKSKITKKKIQ